MVKFIEVYIIQLKFIQKITVQICVQTPLLNRSFTVISHSCCHYITWVFNIGPIRGLAINMEPPGVQDKWKNSFNKVVIAFTLASLLEVEFNYLYL